MSTTVTVVLILIIVQLIVDDGVPI